MIKYTHADGICTDIQKGKEIQNFTKNWRHHQEKTKRSAYTRANDENNVQRFSSKHSDLSSPVSDSKGTYQHLLQRSQKMQQRFLPGCKTGHERFVCEDQETEADEGDD